MASINYKPMIISLVFIFIIGGIMPSIINSFVPDEQPENISTFVSSLSKFVEKGVCLPRSTSISTYKNETDYDALGNPLDSPYSYRPKEVELNELCVPVLSIITPSFVRENISENVLAFGYLPEAISTPLLSLIIIGFGITAVTLAITILELIPFT